MVKEDGLQIYLKLHVYRRQEQEFLALIRRITMIQEAYAILIKIYFIICIC